MSPRTAISEMHLYIFSFSIYIVSSLRRWFCLPFYHHKSSHFSTYLVTHSIIKIFKIIAPKGAEWYFAIILMFNSMIIVEIWVLSCFLTVCLPLLCVTDSSFANFFIESFLTELRTFKMYSKYRVFVGYMWCKFLLISGFSFKFLNSIF